MTQYSEVNFTSIRVYNAQSTMLMLELAHMTLLEMLFTFSPSRRANVY